MYCAKCEHVTESENITIAPSKNGRLIRRGICITWGKNTSQFVKKGAAGGSFLNTLANNLRFEMHFLDITFLVGNKTLQKIEFGWYSKGGEYINK